MSYRKRAVSVVDVVFALCTVATACAVLSPVIATSQGASSLAVCQTNMQRIGGAMRMYLSDWDRTYPTNRLLSHIGNNQPVSPDVDVPLGRPGIDPNTGKPYKSGAGVCWVEGMYPYIGSITTQDNPHSVWKCPAASIAMYSSSATAAVSYVINYNLLEQPEATSRQDSTLMLLREMDVLVNSAARGGKGSKSGPVQVFDCSQTGSITTAFLTRGDSWLVGAGARHNHLHGSGSNVLFADGHVKLFDTTEFPLVPTWDPARGRYMNPSHTISVTRPIPSLQQH